MYTKYVTEIRKNIQNLNFLFFFADVLRGIKGKEEMYTFECAYFSRKSFVIIKSSNVTDLQRISGDEGYIDDV